MSSLMFYHFQAESCENVILRCSGYPEITFLPSIDMWMILILLLILIGIFYWGYGGAMTWVAFSVRSKVFFRVLCILLALKSNKKEKYFFILPSNSSCSKSIFDFISNICDVIIHFLSRIVTILECCVINIQRPDL